MGVMKSIFKVLAFVVSFATVGGMVTTAFAETQWERDHPRRDQVNDRLTNQNRRINNEVKDGQITKQQANQLHQEDHAIRREERAMSRASRSEGAQSAGERRQPSNWAMTGPIVRSVR
jgi:hypothetical protein